MSLHEDLLEQAGHLAKRESSGRPKQASLRRAISAAYYALFHLLIDEASRLYVADDRLVNCLNRVFAHYEMNEISKSFASGELPKVLDPVKGMFPIAHPLRDVAQAFVDLQQARHDADYNLAERFTLSETVSFVDQARKAIESWETLRKDDLAASTFLLLGCFLTSKNWSKSR